MGFIHNIEPVLINLGPLQVRWYGLMYVIFMLFAFFALPHVARKRGVRLKTDDIYSLLLSGFIVGMIGARIGYFIANDPQELFTIEFFMIWHGGLASYGGLTGALLFAWWYTARKKIGFYALADTVVVVFALLPCFIRIGNFINGELVGTITSVPWAFKFPGYSDFRHPVVLYAFITNIVIFSILWKNRYSAFKEGTLFWGFIGLYAFQRFFTDFFREYDHYLYHLSAAQWISVPLFLFALMFLYRTALSTRFSRMEAN